MTWSARNCSLQAHPRTRRSPDFHNFTLSKYRQYLLALCSSLCNSEILEDKSTDIGKIVYDWVCMKNADEDNNNDDDDGDDDNDGNDY